MIVQETFDLFAPPFRSAFRYTIVWCGCCQREAIGYDAVHNGHNVCHAWRERGLGCECMPMMLTVNHVTYALAHVFDGDSCHCSGDTVNVNGSGRKHAATPEHRAAQLADYWIPRVFRTWPQERHAALRRHLDALARYYGVLDLIRGDE